MAAKSDLYVMTEQAKRGPTPNLGSFPSHVAHCIPISPQLCSAFPSFPFLGHSQLVLTSKPSQPFISTSSDLVFSDSLRNFAPCWSAHPSVLPVAFRVHQGTWLLECCSLNLPPTPFSISQNHADDNHLSISLKTAQISSACSLMWAL